MKNKHFEILAEIPHSFRVGVGFNPLILQICSKLSINIPKSRP